jgi:hypothetical protein
LQLEEEFKDTKEAISLSVSYDRSVVSSTNKADLHNITEILLKVALNNITHQPSNILGIEALEKYNLACWTFQNILKRNIFWNV